jgi:hypothetical protein
LSWQPADSNLARRHDGKPRLRCFRLHQFFVVLENHLRRVTGLQRNIGHVAGH